jgi:hypothetical protein
VSLGPPIGAYWLIVTQATAMPDRHSRISVFSNGFQNCRFGGHVKDWQVSAGSIIRQAGCREDA